jgi:tRNA threonylcarbamoyladenosine biosynthesis protein TsaE
MNRNHPERADLFLKDDAATSAFGCWMAAILQPGDTILLSGGIGAGKTHFARAIIKACLPHVTEVPSPTFTLIQSYDGGAVPIIHADLYRLSHPDDIAELGLEEAMGTAICLIEWPDRLPQTAHQGALHLRFSVEGDGRRVTATGPNALVAHVAAFDCDGTG